MKDFTAQLQVIDKVEMPHVINFVFEQLSRYDTSLLESVKLLPLSKKALLHGREERGEKINRLH